MARRGSSSKRNSRRRNATSVPSLTHSLLRPWSPPSFNLRVIEDRRTHHPLGVFRPAKSFGPRSDTRVVARSSSRPFQISQGFRFAVPERVVVCVRRQRRKEVLHALGRAGSGAGRKRKRRNWMSSISCKR